MTGTAAAAAAAPRCGLIINLELNSLPAPPRPANMYYIIQSPRFEVLIYKSKKYYSGVPSDLLGAGGQVEPRVGLGCVLVAAGLARPRPQAQPLALHPQPELGALAARRLRAAPATLLAQTLFSRYSERKLIVIMWYVVCLLVSDLEDVR